MHWGGYVRSSHACRVNSVYDIGTVRTVTLEFQITNNAS